MATTPSRVTVGITLEAHASAKRLLELIEHDGWRGIGIADRDDRASLTSVLSVAVEVFERNVIATRKLAAALKPKPIP